MGLPRSRTAWLAAFLSYGGFQCGHEELRHMRSLGDVRSWLARPMTGTAETAAAPYWRLLQKLAPEARVVIVRRPVEEAVESFMRLGLHNDGATGRERLLRAFQYGDAKLRQAGARLPGALQVSYADLEREETCARVFEHCLPYSHDSSWWRRLASVNIQCDVQALFRDFQNFLPQIMALADIAAREMRGDLRRRVSASTGE